MALTGDDHLLGQIAVHYKLISPEQNEKAVALASGGKPYTAALMELKLITADQMRWLHSAREQFQAKGAAGAKPTAPTAKPSAPNPATSPPASASKLEAPAPSKPGSGVSAPAPRPSAPAPATSSAPAAPAGDRKLPTLEAILKKGFETGASDVHIHAGAPLQMRTNGTLRDLKTGILTPADTEYILMNGLQPEVREKLQESKDLDTALVIPGVGRFRANFYTQQRGWDAVFRPISATPPTFEQLNLPKALKKLGDFHQGLILFTGPAGSGKSSTLAAFVDMVNSTRPDHIITVEDPIEYVHTPKMCVVNQRQAGSHTLSFANALRAALREDPDIIVIGELRDLETIQLAISAAETGHLVMGTLHTNSAIRTVNRILDVFPPSQQSQIRAMVSESLRAIITQRLIPVADGSRRVPAFEILFVRPAISNLIRDEKTFQIRSMMQTGRADGMCLLDDSLEVLVKAKTITAEMAASYAEDPKRFQ